MNSPALVVASILLLAGCGGGGGGAAAPQVHPTTAPTSSPTSGYKNTATLKLTIPLGAKPGSDKRNPQYVSPNSAIVVVTVNTVDGVTPPTWVTPNPQTVVLSTTAGTPPNCVVTGAVETCTITVAAPPGLVSYTFDVKDASNNVLSTTTVSQQITAGTTTTFTVTLLGVPTTVAIAPTTLTAGTSSSGACVTVEDASGATITGAANYLHAITLTDSDTSGASTMDVNGGTPSTTVTLNSPADIVTCHYSGLAALPFTITASGTGVTGTQTFTPVLSPIVLTGGANLQVDGHAGDPNVNEQTVFFGGTGGSATVNAHEVGWSASPFSKTFSATLDAVTCGSGSVATVTPAGAASGGENFTVAGLTPGVCKVTLTDAVNQSKVFWISISAANVTLQ